MFPDETVNFLVFDFDCHDDKIGGDDGANLDQDWMTEVNAFRKICENNDVPILVERSRSGKGAHIWMFFEKPIPAITARRFGTALLTKGAESVNMKASSIMTECFQLRIIYRLIKNRQTGTR